MVYRVCLPKGAAQPDLCLSIEETEHLVALNVTTDAEDSAYVLMAKSDVDMGKLERLVDKVAEAYKRWEETGDEEPLEKALEELLDYAVERAIALELGERLEHYAPSGAAYEGEAGSLKLYLLDPDMVLNYAEEAVELGWPEAVTAASRVAVAASGRP